MADYNIQTVHDKILGICKALDETCKSHVLFHGMMIWISPCQELIMTN